MSSRGLALRCGGQGLGRLPRSHNRLAQIHHKLAVLRQASAGTRRARTGCRAAGSEKHSDDKGHQTPQPYFNCCVTFHRNWVKASTARTRYAGALSLVAVSHISVSSATPRNKFEAIAHSIRDVLSQRWLTPESHYERQEEHTRD